MTDPSGDAHAPPPPSALPTKDQTNTHEYDFVDSDWISPPFPKDIDWFEREERTIRDAHAYAYQQFGTTYHWSRYVHLGYFAFINCTAFDKVWSQIDKEPLMVHRAIWYNFMFHVDRELPMSEKLNAWAFNVSHPFLEYHDAEYLKIDTIKYPNGIASTLNIEKTNEQEKEPEWIPVTDKKRSNSPTKPPSKEPTGKRGGILRPPTLQQASKKSKKTPKNQKTDKNINEKQTTPSPDPEATSTTTEEVVEPMDIDDASNTSKKSTLLIPDFPPRIPKNENAPLPKVATNDGTHRITVKWTPPIAIDEFENDEHRLNEALFTLVQTLFQDEDGVFYQWDRDQTSITKAASSLTERNARDFVSPKVTFIGSRSLIVFGLRFGFLSGPAKWQFSERTKTALKEQKSIS